MNKKFAFIAAAKSRRKTDIFAANNVTNVTVVAVNLGLMDKTSKK
jgi:hypothetical protein